jgi:iron complex outermembrane receptor protein
MASTLVSLLLAVAPALAQSTGSVAGRVVDASSGAPIADAQISVLNSPQTAATSAEGTFQLTGLTPGRRTFVVVRIGYARMTATATIEAGKVTNLEVKLSASSVRLGEIVVTAEKEEQRIQEAPVAVAVISTEQIERAAIKTPSELTGFVPNLVQAFGGGAGFNLVSIRGVNAVTGATSYENAIAVYVDGVYQFDGADANIQLGDIDRIEVLRGPQGTLYGRGALGGVVSIFTKTPTNAKRGYFSADFGNYSQMKYVGTVSGPLVRDKLFALVEGIYFRRGGISEFPTGLDADKDRTWGGNARVRYLATDKLNFGLNAKIERAPAFGSFPWAESDSFAFANPYLATFGPEPNEEFRNQGGYSFEARYNSRSVQVTSVSAYQRTFRGTGPDGLDVDFTPLKLLTSSYGIEGTFSEPGYLNHAWTEELQLGSAAGTASPFKWTLGGYVFDQNSPIVTDVFIAQALSPFGADYRSQNTSHLDSKGYALFGQATYTINNKVDLTAGLRRDHHTALTSQVGQVLVSGGPTIPVPLRSAEATANAWSPKASIAFRPNERVTVYGLFSRGFRPGGNNLVGVLIQQPSTYQPEFTSNFEGGVKLTSANGRVRANLTGFYFKWIDQQVNSYDFTTFSSVTLNTGRSTSKGVELEFSALPARHLEVDWNLGLLSAKFDSLNLSLDPNNPERYDGNYIPFSPKVTSNLAATTDFPIGSRGNRVVIQGEWRYLGRHFFDLANNITSDPYSLFSARAAVTIGDFDLAVWGAEPGQQGVHRLRHAVRRNQDVSRGSANVRGDVEHAALAVGGQAAEAGGQAGV